jgi:hypothetical protein
MNVNPEAAAFLTAAAGAVSSIHCLASARYRCLASVADPMTRAATGFDLCPAIDLAADWRYGPVCAFSLLSADHPFTIFCRNRAMPSS